MKKSLLLAQIRLQCAFSNANDKLSILLRRKEALTDLTEN
jgi:hypothetical protein